MAFCTALIWISVFKYPYYSNIIYTGCCFAQGSFLWCQLLNFVLLCKSLSNYKVGSSRFCTEVDKLIKFEKRINIALYVGIAILVGSGMIAATTYAVL